MSFVSPTKIICPVCTKTVYVNDEVRLSENLILHKTCFRCSQCNKVLQNTNFSQYEGIYYCKPHFMALFKARGKYDDLAPTSAVSTNLRQSLALNNDNRPAGPADSETPQGAPKKGDMMSALRLRNPQAVQAVIDKKGYHVMFASGAGGISSIETAFTTGNLECGRVMLEAISAALQGQNFVWEKPAEDNKEEDSSAADADHGHNHADHDNHRHHEEPMHHEEPKPYHHTPEPEPYRHTPEPEPYHHTPEPEPYHHTPEPEPYHHTPEPEPVHQHRDEPHHQPEEYHHHPEPVAHHEPEPVVHHQPEPEEPQYEAKAHHEPEPEVDLHQHKPDDEPHYQPIAHHQPEEPQYEPMAHHQPEPAEDHHYEPMAHHQPEPVVHYQPEPEQGPPHEPMDEPQPEPEEHHHHHQFGYQPDEPAEQHHQPEPMVHHHPEPEEEPQPEPMYEHQAPVEVVAPAGHHEEQERDYY